MNVSRSARCLFCNYSRAASTGIRAAARAQRQFHPSPAHSTDDNDNNNNPKPPRNNQNNNNNNNNNGKKKHLQDITRQIKPRHFKPYTDAQKAELRNLYTPDQLAAIEAGEATIDPTDLAQQFGIRRDHMKFRYLDDFSVIEPGVDRHVRAPESNSDYSARLKSEDEFAQDFAAFFADMPENATGADWLRFADSLRLTVGKESNERDPSSARVPDLFAPGQTLANPSPSKAETSAHLKDGAKGQEAEEMTDVLRQLLLSTGYTMETVRSLKTKTVVAHAVVNQTRLGKIRRQYCLSIAGNGQGLLGLGEAKSDEGTDAMLQSKYRAIRNMQPIPRYESRTIFGDVSGKVGAVVSNLMTSPPGFGLRCQYLIFEMCRAAGIHDLGARVNRSRNPMNTVKATYEALMSQKNPEDIARARGKKMVDVRKVYYAGRV